MNTMLSKYRRLSIIDSMRVEDDRTPMFYNFSIHFMSIFCFEFFPRITKSMTSIFNITSLRVHSLKITKRQP